MPGTKRCVVTGMNEWFLLLCYLPGPPASLHPIGLLLAPSLLSSPLPRKPPWVPSPPLVYCAHSLLSALMIVLSHKSDGGFAAQILRGFPLAHQLECSFLPCWVLYLHNIGLHVGGRIWHPLSISCTFEPAVLFAPSPFPFFLTCWAPWCARRALRSTPYCWCFSQLT